MVSELLQKVVKNMEPNRSQCVGLFQGIGMWLLHKLAFGNTAIAHLSLFTEGEVEAPRSRAFSGSLSYFAKQRADL